MEKEVSCAYFLAVLACAVMVTLSRHNGMILLPMLFCFLGLFLCGEYFSRRIKEERKKRAGD